MEIKRGIPVSPGVAIGPALVVDTEGIRIPRRYIDKSKISDEVERLRYALRLAVADAKVNQQAITEKVGKQYGAIFAAHALLIEDPELIREIEQLITQKAHGAEYAVSRTMRRHAKALAALNQPIFSQRSTDLIDIEKSILRHLVGEHGDPLQGLDVPAIILAHDLTPSQTANLDPKYVYAFATEAGGKASHTAIMAGVLEIPAVVGLGRFLMDVSGGDEVIIDGNRGVVILNPDEETRERHLVLQKQFGFFAKRLDELRTLPAQTLDGTRLLLLGNIEFPQESSHCNDRGADGVGLYRTEFLYLNKTEDPNESEQFEAYMSVLRSIGPQKEVVIRTLDLGADKLFHRDDLQMDEKNPFLGMRSVRLCLRNMALFKTQLRAILRASPFGNLCIMFPMVSTLMELRQCRMILADVKEELEEEKIDFNRKIPIGTMIEVPSAALMAEELAKEVDFFSIGTNDLIQYTLAADRTNEHVASLYNAGDPSVLRLIDHVLRAAAKSRIDVCVCGEMSGDPVYTILLVGLGLRQLSMTPQCIPEIKKIIRSISIDEAKQIAQDALRFETARDVNNFLREQTRRILPEVVVN
ncbi:MAG: phosphoenolpyruvate--protein phosphotransferase [Planctomycetes bacterium]|nr:phosphoenolpyruvate--protein phosphotransferase [Planctomycetota bacterium]